MNRHPFFGWTVMWSAFVVAVFGWGLGFYGPPIYLEIVRARSGWSIALISAAVTVHFLVGAVAVANLARAHRRFGVPRVTLAGAVVLGLGIVGWAIAAAPWQLFAAALLSGVGWVALGAAAINAIIAPWFVRRRPFALATAYNGASVGGVIFSSAWVGLSAWLGFPLASALVAVATIAVIAVLARQVLGRAPEAMGQLPDGDAPGQAPPSSASIGAPVARLGRDRAFITLAAGMALGLFAQIGLIAHLFSLLVPVVGAPVAGLASSLATASAIAGRYVMGWAMTDGTDRRVIAALTYAIQALGALAMLAVDLGIGAILAGVLLIGFGIGNTTSLPPLIAQREFAPADVPRVVALTVAIGQASYAFAPAVFGLARESAPGSWLPVFALAVAVQCAGIGAYLSGRGAYRRR